jgi:hypothetical protein
MGDRDGGSGPASASPAPGGVGFPGQLHDGGEEPVRLAFEQTVGGKRLDRGHGAAVAVERWPHDRAVGQVVRNASRFTGSAPLDFRYALRNAAWLARRCC